MLPKLFYGFLTCIIISYQCAAQELTTLPDGGNKKALVGEWIGITDVLINYNRPAVKGRDGQIWGKLVPYGFTDLGFGTSKASPWRAGANENTSISFSTDVMVEGKLLAAGTYGLFIAMQERDATIIFSKNHSSWGSYFYDPKEDALRVTVQSVKLSEKTERLKFEFMDQKENSAVIALFWENLKIPFTVSVDYIKTQLESFRKELRSSKGFNKDAWTQAANFCVANNTNLEEALQWSDYAINAVFTGEKTFTTLNTKAAVLEKLGRKTAADSLIKEAIKIADVTQLHNYARQLLRDNKKEEALTAFKLNAEKHPNLFTTNIGLARGYSANADYKKALKFIQLALPQAPNEANIKEINKYIILLKNNKDFN